MDTNANSAPATQAHAEQRSAGEMSHKDQRKGLPSASSAERLVRCPGSFLLESTCPEPPESKVATDGTDIHAAWETDMPEETGVADQLRAAEAELVGQWLAHLGTECIPDEAVRERRLWIYDSRTALRTSSAKPDVIFLIRFVGSVGTVLHALAIDGKTGYLPVKDAAKNWQTRVQAIAVMNEWPDVQSVRVALARCRFGKDLSFCDYERADLEHAARLWDQALWYAKQVDAHRIPGAWCKYCRASAYCPERAAVALYALTAPKTTDSEAAQAWKALKGAEKLAKDMAVRVKALPPETLAATGLRLVDGDDMRKFTSNDDVVAALSDYIDKDALLGLSTFKLGALEKALVPVIQSRDGLETKRAAEKRFDELAEQFTTKEPKAAKLEVVE